MLHPPVLRALGLQRKVALGPWFEPGLRALRTMRRVRGTPLDLFGYAEVRRTERSLPVEYLDMVLAAVGHAAARFDLVLELCQAPDEVRGYEQIKLDSVHRWRTRSRRLLEQILDGAAA
jgi:indolepyruvate ferredoxin oxidoreductase